MHKYFEQYRVTGEWFNIDFDMACTKLKEMFKQYAITITSRDNIKLYDYYSGIKSNFKNTTMKLFLSKEILTKKLLYWRYLTGCTVINRNNFWYQ